MSTSSEQVKERIKSPAPTVRSGNAVPDTLSAWWGKNESRVSLAAGGDDKAKQIYLSLMQAFDKNPKLRACTAQSLGTCLMISAMTGLLPEPWGDAHFIPYGDKATWMPDYKGLARLARETEFVASIDCEEVRANDHFAYKQGTTRVVEFSKEIFGDRGEAIGVYCVLTLHNGEKEIGFMTTEEVEKIRQASPGKNSEAWRSHWGEMAKKTILKRMLKTHVRSKKLHLSIEADNAVERPDIYGGNQETTIEDISTSSDDQ